ncbi:DUF4411 family protein [uncultured Thiohalocapsa sp.]|mgnify:CR=1 FL=1|uniref:DUF4411 family protein n=1 Tax=uncultured Thiohalocapsa sp. TaxID=768990 RepID=UPI0025D80AA4|nr:DUF4411 family protein [uncultured Thiohalocapsa sp.]
MTVGTAKAFVLDANVFIEAHRRYYGFDLCPGFWVCLDHHHAGARLLSIDRVRSELQGGDALAQWVKHTAPDSLFVSTRDQAVVEQYSLMMQWVQAQAQFRPEAKAEFAAVADGWLAAFAKARGNVLVTHEEHAPDARKRVPLPNVCEAFGVDYLDTFAMLRALKASFSWMP